MNFRINKKKLNEVMQRISKLFSVTVIMPIFKGIQIKANREGVSITITDGTVSMKEFISTDVEIYEDGECVVDGKLFFEIIRKLSNENIWIRIENNQIKIKSGKAEMKLVIFQTNQYPQIDFSYPKNKMQLNIEEFQNAINKTLFAASDQQTRPVLGGLNFNVDENLCIVVGTDSYRLARIEIPVISNQKMNITIPKKYLSLTSVIYTKNEDIFIYFDNHKVLMANSTVIIQSTLLEGKFPDVERLLPEHFDTQIFFSSKLLIEALERTSFCKDDGVTSVIFEMLTDEIVLTSESKEIGSSIETVPYISINGNKEVKFCCNQQYFLEALRALGDNECILRFNEDMKPFILTNKKIEGEIQLLLPIRR